MEQSEIHLFIIWGSAEDFFTPILEDIQAKLLIKNVIKVTWSDHLFSSNLTRFYGVNLPVNSDKEQHIGRKSFHAIIIQDNNPIYEERETSKGLCTVNINTFDLKTKYRLMTGGGHKVHATNSVKEALHDIWLLFGVDCTDYLAKGLWDNRIATYNEDLQGANGWESITCLFSMLNKLSNYIVLRNFECLPDDYHLEMHGDIDLLVESIEEVVFLTNSIKVFPEEHRVHYKILIKEEYVFFDFRYLADNYYCQRLEKELLSLKAYNEGGFFTPSLELYFYSLLYHALIHKPIFAKDYIDRLSDLSDTLNMFFDGTEKHGLFLLFNYMYENHYAITVPNDISVYFKNHSINKELSSLIDNNAVNYLDKLTKISDLTIASSEIGGVIDDFSSQYAFSHRRANLLKPFEEHLKNKRVLEIGCRCGVISRYLGEIGAQVTAVESNTIYANIAKYRCQDISNVKIVCIPINALPDLGQFDVILLVGILEYARCFLGKDGQEILLKDCHSRLTKDGQLFIAIENKLGIKYFAGAPEDHVGISMHGINSAYTDDSVVTFGRYELKTLINNVGFKEIEEYLPLPDYKLPCSIVTPLGWKKYSNELSTLALESAYQDAQGVSDSTFSVEIGIKNIWNNNLASGLSNSFLMVAGKDATPNLHAKVSAYHYSDGRKKQYQKFLIIYETADNQLRVHSQKSFPKLTISANDLEDYSQSIQSDLEFIHGKSLFTELVEIVNKENWSIKDITIWLKEWLDALLFEANLERPFSLESKISNLYTDSVSFNTIKTKSGFKFFDLEWQTEVELGFVIYRNLLASLSRITSVASPEHKDSLNLNELIKKVMFAIGLDLSNEKTYEYLSQEAALYSLVALNFNKQAWIDHVSKKHLIERLLLGEQKSNIETHKSQIEQQKREIEQQKREIEQQKREIEQQKREIEQQKREIEQQQRHALNLQEQINTIYNSKSWKVTKPLRYISSLLKHFK